MFRWNTPGFQTGMRVSECTALFIFTYSSSKATPLTRERILLRRKDRILFVRLIQLSLCRTLAATKRTTQLPDLQTYIHRANSVSDCQTLQESTCWLSETWLWKQLRKWLLGSGLIEWTLFTRTPSGTSGRWHLPVTDLTSNSHLVISPAPLFPTRLYHTTHRETLGQISPPPYSSRSPDTLGRTVDTRFGDQLTRGCLVAAGLVQLVSVVPFWVGPSDREAFR